MINGLNLPSYKSQIGDGLYLTGTIKGKGCDIKCNKKRAVKKHNGKGLVILE